MSLVFLSAAVFSGEIEVIDSFWKKDLQPFEAGRFISPDACGECHDEIYAMWDGSLHARAMDDLLFRAASKLFVSKAVKPGEKEDAEHCVACHNPIAYRSGAIPGSSGDYSNVDAVTSHSLSCDLCHSVDEVVMTKNASINADPGNGEDEPGTKRGPRDDAQPMFHEAAYSTLHTSSEFCGACHNVTHLWYMTKLEGTYDEWYGSAYNSPDPSKRITCQECHMRQSPGKPSTGMTDRPDYPGRAAGMAEERPHIYRHYVVGANTLMPGLLGSPDRAELAEERLKNAAVLDIPLNDATGKTIETVTVRVRNEGAGHMLPTGVTEFRQMWLEVTVRDGKGKELYSSGGITPDGSLQKGTCIFQTVFGDPEGKPTVNVSEAAYMLTDHRVPPKGWIDETFHLGKSVQKPVVIHAELKYRSMDPALVKLLLTESHDVPVVTMAVKEMRIE